MPMRLYLWQLSMGLLGLSLLVIQPGFADSSDWVQVERFKQVLKEAQEGKLQSMYEVGRNYERGRGTRRNMQKAAEWYNKAANASHAPSMARLGILYVEGNGVKRDLAKAVELLTKASARNVASAQYQLANMYELGMGVDEDLEQAISLYHKAANGGYYRAENKVKELSSLLARNKPGSTPAGRPAQPTPNTPRPSARVLATIAAILQGNWERSSRPAGYLPSSISNCRGQNQKIKCISTAQERSTGTEIITYSTEATLSNFNGKRFQITYTNNVLEVEQQERTTALGYEEEESQASNARIKAGQQGKSHKLDCTLEKPKRINCVKDRLRTLHFTSL